MNTTQLPDYIARATPMTVGELKKKIHNLPSDTKIYIVIDKISPDAWDEERDQWRYAIPLVYANREKIAPDEFSDGELNLLLEYESE